MMSSRKDFSGSYRAGSCPDATNRVAASRCRWEPYCRRGRSARGEALRRSSRSWCRKANPAPLPYVFRRSGGGRLPVEGAESPGGFRGGIFVRLVSECCRAVFGVRVSRDAALRPAAPCRAPEAGRAAGVLPRRYILPLACPKFQKKSYLCRRVGKTARKWLRRPQCGGFNIRQI